ncbi:hypothetical protein D9M69_233740 [compost metagenome]
MRARSGELLPGAGCPPAPGGQRKRHSSYPPCNLADCQPEQMAVRCAHQVKPPVRMAHPDRLQNRVDRASSIHPLLPHRGPAHVEIAISQPLEPPFHLLFVMLIRHRVGGYGIRRSLASYESCRPFCGPPGHPGRCRAPDFHKKSEGDDYDQGQTEPRVANTHWAGAGYRHWRPAQPLQRGKGLVDRQRPATGGRYLHPHDQDDRHPDRHRFAGGRHRRRGRRQEARPHRPEDHPLLRDHHHGGDRGRPAAGQLLPARLRHRHEHPGHGGHLQVSADRPGSAA